MVIGEVGGGRQFYCINNMAYVYLLFYSLHFQAFFANRACTQEIEMMSTMRIKTGRY